MGRKSSLTEKQWAEIGRRLLKGEAGRVLAREYGVSEAAIRKRFGAQTKQIKDVANQLVAAESAFSALPIGAQISARTLADELKEISMHLAGAARYGAATAHRLSGIAHNKAGEIDDAEPLADNEQGACALQKIAQNIQDAANQALQFMAEWVGEKEGGHIKLHTDFGAESLAATSAEQLLKAQLAGVISPETLFGEFKRRNIISMDIDWDGELARIESQGPALRVL